jgi:hypothetical protein
VDFDRPEEIGDDSLLVRPNTVDAVDEQNRCARCTDFRQKFRGRMAKPKCRREGGSAIAREAIRLEKEDWAPVCGFGGDVL